MVSNIEIDNRSTKIFIIAYGILLTYSLLGKIPGFGEILKNISYVSIIIFSYLSIYNLHRVQLKQALIVIALYICSFIIVYSSNDYSIFKLILISSAACFVDFKKCVKFDIIFRFVLIPSVIGLCYAGIAPDEIVYTDGAERHSLGFVNPNVMAISFFILCLDILYLCGMKISKWNTLICLAIMYYTSSNSGSRTPVLVFCIVIICSIIYTLKPNFFFKRIIRWLIINSPIILALITLFLTIFVMSNGIFIDIPEKYLSLFERFQRNYTFYTQFGLSVFGNNLEIMEMSLDNFYAYSLLALGLFGTSFYLLYLSRVLKFFFNKENFPLVLIFVCFVIYGLSEKFWMYADYNIFMITFGYIFMSKRIK